MEPDDLTALKNAVRLLEHPSLAARLTNLAGKPVELIGLALPASVSQAITSATSKSLAAALQVAPRTMPPKPFARTQLLHKAPPTASGPAGRGPGAGRPPR